LLLPYLPLGGNWLSYVPLVDGHWVDRRVVELCEASAFLKERGFTRVPSLDGHSLAWHRFFPAHTRWRDPKEAPREEFLTALEEISGTVSTIPGSPREIAGRPFVHIDDYARWRSRHVPRDYMAEAARHVGIPIGRWNAWIEQDGPDGKVDLFGTVLTKVESPRLLREGESFTPFTAPEQAEQAIEQRAEVIRGLVRLASFQAAPSGSDSAVRGRQLRILQALADSGPMGGADLAVQVGCDRRTLYKPGGLRELIDRGLVGHEFRNAFVVTDAGRSALNRK
jgi:hypothetical protein